MKKTIIGILISFFLTTSCQNKEKKNEMENNANIEFTDLAGNKISKDELSKSTGTFNYEIYGIESVSNIAKSLHNQAREFGQKGDYKNAIDKLEKANKEAPNWAYPLYDLAYTYLLQDDYENALKYYQLTDKVAPNGFYTSKTALNTLEKERKGEFKKGLYKTYLSLEWIENSSEKQEMIKLLVDKFPNFAPAWKDYSNILEGENRMKAIEKGLSLNPDIQTKGSLLINKALMINENGDLKKATKILTKIIFDKNSTYGNIEMAKFVLNNITEK
jgi:tetratricopeptide (TPR) repeat protein